MRIPSTTDETENDNATITLPGGFDEQFDHLALLNALGTFLPASNEEESDIEIENMEENELANNDYENTLNEDDDKAVKPQDDKQNQKPSDGKRTKQYQSHKCKLQR